MKAFAVCALALLGAFAVPSAHASDAPTLKLDLAQSQDLTVDASGVQLEQLLKTLGEQLHFTVDFSPLANRSALVSGKFEGDLDELLADILRGTNYVARRGPQGVTHLVVMTASNASPATAPAASGKTVAAVEVKSPSQPAPVAAQAPPPAPVAQATAVVQNGGNSGPPSVVSKLLSAQAGAMLSAQTGTAMADPNAAAGVPAAGTQSLGVMTHVAQANVQALAAALNAACIGAGCAH